MHWALGVAMPVGIIAIQIALSDAHAQVSGALQYPPPELGEGSQLAGIVIERGVHRFDEIAPYSAYCFSSATFSRESASSPSLVPVISVL